MSDINSDLIQQWAPSNIDEILASTDLENDLLMAYENGLYQTPAGPRLNPREMIYILTTQKYLEHTFIKEVKLITKSWINKTAESWNQNVPPFYSTELNYIITKF